MPSFDRTPWHQQAHVCVLKNEHSRTSSQAGRLEAPELTGGSFKDAGRAFTIASLRERVGCQEAGVSPHVGTFRSIAFLFAAGNLLQRIVLVSPLCAPCFNCCCLDLVTLHLTHTRTGMSEGRVSSASRRHRVHADASGVNRGVIPTALTEGWVDFDCRFVLSVWGALLLLLYLEKGQSEYCEYVT